VLGVPLGRVSFTDRPNRVLYAVQGGVLCAVQIRNIKNGQGGRNRIDKAGREIQRDTSVLQQKANHAYSIYEYEYNYRNNFVEPR